MSPSSSSPSTTPSQPTPQALRASYSHFLPREAKGTRRFLLTGHSHQAWPDVAREGVLEAFHDAAKHVDDKWSAVFERAELIREDIGRVIDAEPGEIALAQNTHELFTRFLSALPLSHRPVVIATSGEFHSVYRQLNAAAQAGLLEIKWVNSETPHDLAERLIQELKIHGDRCSAVVSSSVLFQSGAIVPHLDQVAWECQRRGTRLFVDAYHSFKVVPISLRDFGDASSVVYLSGGGYKYAQWGEGVCWLRVPEKDEARPVFTGWFSDFEHLHLPRYDQQGRARLMTYGSRPAERFAGSTFDPCSLYRAAKVSQFFQSVGLSVDNLRAISLAQTQRLIDGFSEHFEFITPHSSQQRGGFVALKVSQAHEWSVALRELNVFTDARGDSLRFGPAPYLLNDEIDEAIERTLTLKAKRSRS